MLRESVGAGWGKARFVREIEHRISTVLTKNVRPTAA